MPLRPESKEEGDPASAVSSTPTTGRTSSDADADASHDAISIHGTDDGGASGTDLERITTHQASHACMQASQSASQTH
jgi:hypothetical protein